MDTFLGQIKMVGFNFAPVNYAICDGSLFPIMQHQATYALLGTTFGGDGRTTFGVPNLVGRAPIQHGYGPGLTPYMPGQVYGTPSVTLTDATMPAHNHPMFAKTDESGETSPTNKSFGQLTGGLPPLRLLYKSDDPQPTTVEMNGAAVDYTGDGTPHENRQPLMALNFVICMDGGAWPSRS